METKEFTYSLSNYPVSLAIWHWNMNGVATPISGDSKIEKSLSCIFATIKEDHKQCDTESCKCDCHCIIHGNMVDCGWPDNDSDT